MALRGRLDGRGGCLVSRRLAMESAVIVRIAERPSGELKRRDPLAERVELTKAQFLHCGLSGIAAVLFRRGGKSAALTPLRQG